MTEAARGLAGEEVLAAAIAERRALNLRPHLVALPAIRGTASLPQEKYLWGTDV